MLQVGCVIARKPQQNSDSKGYVVMLCRLQHVIQHSLQGTVQLKKTQSLRRCIPAKLA